VGRVGDETRRVLHLPANTDGIPWANVQALRRRGAHAELAVFDRGTVYPETDWVIDLLPDPIRRGAARLHAFLRFMPTFDVFHFYGSTLLPARLQFRALRLARRRSVVHLVAGDVRSRTAADLAWMAAADARVADSHATARLVPDAHVIPPPIDLAAAVPVPPTNREPPLAVYAPTADRADDTAMVVAACTQLGVELDVVEGVHHDDAFERYKAADLAIGSIGADWYGSFEIEAMALGKPVVAALDRDVLRQSEEAFATTVPIVTATRETLVERLRPLVADPDERRRVGVAGRAYVERVHDANTIADRLIDVYARL
jgi:hypothetical protein